MTFDDPPQTDGGGPRHTMAVGNTPYLFSVCICTRNRPDDLRTALLSIAASTYPVTTIVVSDDSTDPRTSELVRREFPHATFVEGPRRGLCANRNAAVVAATGTHLLYMDDDAELGPKFVADVASVLDAVAPAQRHRTIVTGCERLPGNQIVVANRTNFLGYQSIPYRSGEKLQTIVINAAVFPIELFSEIGFDENLVYGSDEVDICGRAVAKGYTVLSAPTAINDHRPSAVNRDSYGMFKDASRLYVTFKRYWFAERSYLKGAVYGILGPLHLIARSVLKDASTFKDRIAGLRNALASVWLALTYLRHFCRARTDAPARHQRENSDIRS